MKNQSAKPFAIVLELVLGMACDQFRTALALIRDIGRSTP